jgi:hypothetical protein
MTHFRPHFPCSLDSGNGFFFNTFAVFWWTICDDKEEYEKERSKIKERLTQRGYNSNLIEKQLLKVDELLKIFSATALPKRTEIWWEAPTGYGRFCIKFPQSRMKGE